MLNTRSLMRIGAVLASGALVGLGAAPAAAEHDATSVAESDAAVGTGLFATVESLIQAPGSCVATNDADNEEGTTSGNCTPSIDLNPAQVLTQFATADPNGLSAAEAGTAGVPITDLAYALDLTELIDDLGALESGTLLAGLGDIITTLDGLGLLDQLLTPVDSVLGTVLDGLQSSLPLSLEIGAVFAECNATPTSAEGSSTVAGINLLVELGGQQIVVPIEAGTAPNSNLLVGAPNDLVQGILAGLEVTLTDSLGGALSPLVTAVVAVEDIVEQLTAALEPTLLQALADLLAPVISGMVNVQDPVSPDTAAPFEIDVTALQLTVLGTNTLSLANVHCGPNTAGTPHDGEPTPPSPSPEEPEVPTVIDAGSGGNAAGLVAAIVALGAAAGVAGHRVRRSLI